MSSTSNTPVAGMPFEENGIWVNFPDTNYFQFQDIPEYKSISSQSIREMDFGWFDNANDTMFLIELKAYHNPSNPHHQPTNLADSSIRDTKLQELYEKSVHSVSMLYSTRSPVRPILPAAHLETEKLRLIHILNIPNALHPYLSIMQDVLRNRLKPYKAIFDINSIVIIDYTTACNKFTWAGNPNH